MRHHQPEVTAVADFLAVKREDDVAFVHAGGGGRRTAGHFRNQRARRPRQLEFLRQVLRHRLHHHAEITAGHLPVLDDAFHHRAGEIDGHGESDALVPARAAENRRIDSDQTPLRVDERPAGIPRIDGSVGLDEILVIDDAHPAAAQSADVPDRDRLADSEGIADREHGIPHLHPFAVGEGDGGEIGGLDPQDRHVGRLIRADELGRVFLAVGQYDLNPVGPRDHVVVGQNVAVGAHQHPGAEAPGAAFARNQRPPIFSAKQVAPDRIVVERIERVAQPPRRVNIHHAARGPLRHRREARGELGLARERRLLHRELRQRRGLRGERRRAGDGTDRRPPQETGNREDGFHNAPALPE